jgi:bacterioferritin-associated ferredoxin
MTFNSISTHYTVTSKNNLRPSTDEWKGHKDLASQDGTAKNCGPCQKQMYIYICHHHLKIPQTAKRILKSRQTTSWNVKTITNKQCKSTTFLFIFGYSTIKIAFITLRNSRCSKEAQKYTAWQLNSVFWNTLQMPERNMWHVITRT